MCSEVLWSLFDGAHVPCCAVYVFAGNSGVWLIGVSTNGEVDSPSNYDVVGTRKDASIAMCEEHTCDHKECKEMCPLTMSCQWMFLMLCESYHILHNWCNVCHSCFG